jgi:RNA polymerase-binding transcription factor DksA
MMVTNDREIDPTDVACAENEAFQESAVAIGLQKARAGMAPIDEWRTASATHCGECGDCIPDERRKAVPGCQVCANCKQFAELMTKQRVG